MAKKYEENVSRKVNDTYYISANFIENGTVFSGMLKLRKVIEAGVVMVIVRLPVFKRVCK